MPKKLKKNDSAYKTNRAMRRGRLSIQATPDTDAIRTEMFQGVEHMVVPVIALCEGVIWPANAPYPELALASEFGRVPDGWNGRPICFDHPKVDGIPVSANSPAIAENHIFGQMFNTVIDDRKLKSEMWINTARVAELSQEIQNAVERLAGGEMSEVSTGVFTSLEVAEGTFEGQDFGGIWRECVPDHLCILPEGVTGASSNEMGAGAPRINAERVNVDDNETEKQGLFAALSDSLYNKLGLSTQGMSDRDLRTALDIALSDIYGDEYTWIVSIFSAPEDQYIIYEVGFDGMTWKLNYTLAADGTITFAEEAFRVRPETTFVPANANETKENSEMDPISAERVEALIANAANAYTQDDTEMLTALAESVFATLESASTPAEPVVEEPAPAASPEVPEVTANEGEKTPATVDSYINDAPDEIRQVLNSGLTLHRENKAKLVKGITANASNTFTEDQLNGMEISMLQQIADLAVTEPDYTGTAPVINAGGNNNDRFADEPVPIFGTK